MKVGLYSITYLGIWYEGGALGLAELFARAREMGYSGVELDGRRPHANPMDLDAHPWLGEPDVDNVAFVEALREVGYDGYLCYEFCHTAIDTNGRGPRERAYVYTQAALAREYMTDVLRTAGALTTATSGRR